jgi:predicted acyl esterase
MGQARRLGVAAAIAVGTFACGAGPAAAATVTVKTLHFATTVGPNDDVKCDVVGDLYKPSTATRATPAPAILTTNGFGGSKDDQAKEARAYAERGYVVLSYSGLGFGGSACKITLDDRDFDGKAGSQLVSFLGGSKKATDGTAVDYVRLDAVGADGKARPDDPRVGMIGGSYGGQIQFAVAGIDPRVDALIPIITWNDLAYSLAPNNTSFTKGVTYQTPGIEKFGWVSLFFAVGQEEGLKHADADPSRLVGLCPNFDDRACTAKAQMDATGAPNDTTIALARHASVSAFLDDVRIPTLLAQGQADTLFNLQESVATYDALRARKVPVKLIWQSWGHSSSTPAPGELDRTKPEGSYEGRAFLSWFDHYLKDAPAAPSLDFTFFRDWQQYTGDATPAYGRTDAYPVVAKPTDLFTSGTDALVAAPGDVQAGSASLVTPAAGAPSSYTETSALDQSGPVTDAPGTAVRFTSAPLAADSDVIGVPSVDLRIAAPTAQTAGGAADSTALTLFFKLYDIAPDGTVVLAHRLISPVRVTNPSLPVHVELPGIVHRFAKGHRFALAVSGGDAAYRGGTAPTAVQFPTDPARPGVLHLPIAPASSYGKVVEAAAPAALSARQCGSRRAFAVHVRRQFRSRVRATTVRVDGRTVARLGRRTSRYVSLKGRRRATVTVQLVMTLKGGRRVTDTRHYRTCTKR